MVNKYRRVLLNSLGMHVLLCAKRLLLFLSVGCAVAAAQIRVYPHWVSINTTGATTAFLTFDGAAGFRSEEAIWCGEIMDASPDHGQKPVPGTIFGSLPTRLNLSSLNSSGVFTDIMSIPPSVARRAYQAAAEGARSTFFYVRHFINSSGGPDEYVAVTCELSSGGAHTPFALTAVGLSFEDETNVATMRAGERVPRFTASINYTGTGQLHGRWEVVRPGDLPPADEDLLTESTLPVEKRGLQRRYTEVERFSVFLPPIGKYLLQGPDPLRLPHDIGGQYLILLRIESSLDVESTSDFAASGVSGSPVEAGGVAGFAIPPLRYYVEDGPSLSGNGIVLLFPDDMSIAGEEKPVNLAWTPLPAISLYNVVVIDPRNAILFSAMVGADRHGYRLDPWLWKQTDARHVEWSVQALTADGTVLSRSEWRTLWRGAEPKGP